MRRWKALLIATISVSGAIGAVAAELMASGSHLNVHEGPTVTQGLRVPKIQAGSAPSHAQTTTRSRLISPAAPSVRSSNEIPQGNAGDADADNNGGPSDEDGGI